MFRVGQKVTMIAPWSPKWGNRKSGYRNEVLTEFGVVYTIRGILDVFGTAAIHVCEISNPVQFYRVGGKSIEIEQPFPLENFRPVVEHKTDISIFTKMLDGAPIRIDA